MNLWKRKLAAYLHDPPSKCLDIRTHGERSDRALAAAGFTQEERHAFAKQADFTASSADRFPFPGSRSAGLTCVFDGVRAGFHHPLGGLDGAPPPVLSFGNAREIIGAEAIEGQLEEHEQTIQPILSSDSLARLPEDLDPWCARFFAHWRLWPQFAADRDGRFTFLPADTRLPDHTIWTHNATVAALAGCATVDAAAPVTNPEEWFRALRAASLRPAFLKFQLGPVQEFIAQARSTRDLWSGSYLLSWLVAAGLKALSAKVGPDAVIYPNLRGQPLFDLHWRDELWRKVRIGDRSVWDSMRETVETLARDQGRNPHEDLLTPNLPNVFLALVPAARAEELGRSVAEAVCGEWKNICESVWVKVSESGLLELCPPKLKDNDKARERFLAQTERLLNIAWHALAWPNSLAEARRLAAVLPVAKPGAGEKSLLERFDAVVHAATVDMPKDHRDARYYVDGDKGSKDTLNNIGLGWALLTAVNGWELDAVRQTRNFAAWSAGGWPETGVAQSKDALTGREEMIFGGRGLTDRMKELGNLEDSEEWQKLFKHDDEVGAITLVKRVWHWSYLAEKWKLRARRGQFPMPSTLKIAGHRPFDDDDEQDVGEMGDEVKGRKYFAVLALDGDEIGKWVSGDKTPRYRTQFAEYPDSGGVQRSGSLEYFERDSDPDGRGTLKDRFAGLLDTRRLVSPSYHLQFSEALSNFALRCARRIVEAFDGRLIYSGGDDVLAMLPADTALPCAQALRAAFRGRETKDQSGHTLFSSPAHGFLTTEQWKDDHGRGTPIPFLVPGPAADCSVGIAIAHFKSPLQDVVREAQRAEKRAKNQLGRSAVAVTLMKRSGETIEWGCRWDSGGLQVFDAIMDALRGGAISRKFPHRVVELLNGYLTETSPLAAHSLEPLPDFPVIDVVGTEFAHALDRQAQDKAQEAYTRLRATADTKPPLQSPLLKYLHGLRDAAEQRLSRAKRENWDSLREEERRNLQRGPTETPIQALIGLCQTVAFIERNLPEDESDIRPPKTETETLAERQPV